MHGVFGGSALPYADGVYVSSSRNLSGVIPGAPGKHIICIQILFMLEPRAAGSMWMAGLWLSLSQTGQPVAHKVKGRMVNLPGKALGGVLGFWYENKQVSSPSAAIQMSFVRAGKDHVGCEPALCSHGQMFNRCSGSLLDLASVLCVTLVH